MNNNTRDDYKNAIRAKYEIEKEGDFSNFFDPTSPANLRNLCWEKFISNEKTDDLNIFSSVFGFEFNIERSKHFSTTTTDKFRPVMSFLKGEKEAAKFNRVELAAILVDFNPRPFKKFKEKGVVQIENIKGSIESINSPSLPQTFFTKELIKNDDSIEIKDDNTINEESFLEDEILNQEENFWQDEIFTDVRIPNGNENFRLDEVLDENLKEVEEEKNKEKQLVTLKERFFRRILNRSKSTIAATVIIFILVGAGSLATVIYFNFFKKGCMQWSGDHYDEVSCNLEIQGIGTYNSPEPYDERIINLKKIKVCDTTAFFKNEEAVVWYTKVGDGVEFFNTHGLHPENGKALRPVTQYIINKYVKKH